MDAAELAARGCDDRQHQPAGEHLHRRPDERTARELRVTRVQRADRPGQRAEDEHERGPASRPAPAARGDEQADAGKADEQPEHDGAGEPLPVEGTVEQRHPQRNGGDDQRRGAGVQRLLGPADGGVADDEHRRRDQERRQPLARGRAVRALTASDRPGVQQAAGDEEASRRHQEGRNRPDREIDPEVGRAPDDVDGGERQPDAPACYLRPGHQPRRSVSS